MYLIKVDDGFVEWAFELEGSDEYSIQDIVDVICKNTNLQVVKPAQLSVQRTGLNVPDHKHDFTNSLYCHICGQAEF